MQQKQLTTSTLLFQHCTNSGSLSRCVASALITKDIINYDVISDPAHTLVQQNKLSVLFSYLSNSSISLLQFIYKRLSTFSFCTSSK